MAGAEGSEGSGAECGCLRVANASSGGQLLCIPWARDVWPDSGGEQNEHDLDVLDVLYFCGIPRQELALCDLLNGRGQLLTMGMAVPCRQGEDMHLRFVRNRCPRCTVCNNKCRRMSSHVLCSHRCIAHLWRNAGQSDQASLVEGYMCQAGLESLPREMVDAEIAAIRREQSTQGTELSRASTPQPSAVQGGRAHQ